jgi:hypothetical protein
VAPERCGEPHVERRVERVDLLGQQRRQHFRPVLLRVVAVVTEALVCTPGRVLSVKRAERLAVPAGFGRKMSSRGRFARRPPISLHTIVARTRMHTTPRKFGISYIVQGFPFSVAPCVTIRNFCIAVCLSPRESWQYDVSLRTSPAASLCGSLGSPRSARSPTAATSWSPRTSRTPASAITRRNLSVKKWYWKSVAVGRCTRGL